MGRLQKYEEKVTTVPVRMHIEQFEEVSAYMSEAVAATAGFRPKQMGKYIAEFVRSAVDEKLARVKKK